MQGDLFKISIRALIQDGDKVLLANEDYEGTWETPGGRLKRGESIIECLKREAREKTGFEVYPEGVIDFAAGKKPGSNLNALHIIFKCKLDYSKKMKRAEGVRTKWFSLKELKKLVDDRQTDWHDERVFNQLV